MLAVSVVIPAKNRAHTLPRALASVLAQGQAVHEVCVVDDGSTDETAAVVESLAEVDGRVRLLHSNSGGAQAARNSGIRAAIAPWIAFLDSDDEWLPGGLAPRIAKAEQSGTDVITSEGLVERAGVRAPIALDTIEGDRPLARALERPGPMFQGILVRASALAACGLLDERVTSYQEWDTTIRLARVGRFAHVPKPTFVWHMQTDSISNDDARTARGYAQVVGLHKDEIRAYLGRRGLARHALEAARLHRAAGLTREALVCMADAAACWPPSVARWAAGRVVARTERALGLTR